VVTAHLCAREAAEIGFGRFIITATTPFSRQEVAELGANAHACSVDSCRNRRYLLARAEDAATLDRVYVNERARRDWVGNRLRLSTCCAAAAGADWRARLTRQVGSKNYHPAT
jgi:UDP-glucose 4-epimerase